MPLPDPTAGQPLPNDLQALPPNAPGIPGVGEDPLEITEEMKHDFADAAPSDGTGISGNLRQKPADPPRQDQPGGPA